MRYRKLGNSGLEVSEIGLGGNNFGFRLNEQESISIISHALDNGVNFIDTSNWYSQRGLSEQFIGKAIKGKRSQVVIATKFSFKMGDGPNEKGASRSHILQAIDDSLKRLNTDYIDLYQIHRPDPGTPLLETLSTLNDLVRAGKVRYIGCCNFKAWQVCDASWISQTHNFEPFITVQTEYNILNRSIENELVPLCRERNIGVIPWGPLAGGFLTGKYSRANAPSPGTRLHAMKLYNGYFTEGNFDKLVQLKNIADKHNRVLSDVAISWLLSRPYISSVICAATSKDQISANIASAGWKLPQKAVSEIEEITSDLLALEPLWGDLQ